MAATQYRVDGRLWKDLYQNSGANIEWLIENGVEFSGEVNDYGTGAGIVSRCTGTRTERPALATCLP